MIKKLLQHKALLLTASSVIVIIFVFGAYQVWTLHKAHSTFGNYYVFRGCTQLIEKTPTYGVCKTGSGQIITIVLYHGKWYLKGDLPTGLLVHLS